MRKGLDGLRSARLSRYSRSATATSFVKGLLRGITSGSRENQVSWTGTVCEEDGKCGGRAIEYAGCSIPGWDRDEGTIGMKSIIVNAK